MGNLVLRAELIHDVSLQLSFEAGFDAGERRPRAITILTRLPASGFGHPTRSNSAKQLHYPIKQDGMGHECTRTGHSLKLGPFQTHIAPFLPLQVKLAACVHGGDDVHFIAASPPSVREHCVYFHNLPSDPKVSIEPLCQNRAAYLGRRLVHRGMPGS